MSVLKRMGGPELRVEEATDADVDALVALWDECGLTRPWNDAVADARLALATETSTVLVGRCAVNGTDVLAAGALVGFDGHRGWVYYLAVSPLLRRHGSARG